MGRNICGCLLPKGEAGLSKGDVREAHPNYMGVMCGRVIQSSAPFNLAIVPYIFDHQRKPRNVRMTFGFLGMAGGTGPTT
jgi:hypothetical protein